MANIDFIFALLQTYVEFIAFATIVATLRQSFGKPLTPFQYLLFRFFVESGLLHVILLLVPVFLYNIYGDVAMVWEITTGFVIVVPFFYAVNYLSRRRKVPGVHTPASTVLVIVGYAAFMLFNLSILLGDFPVDFAASMLFEPSVFTVSLYFMWSMVAVVLVFLTFLGTFIDYDKSDTSNEADEQTVSSINEVHGRRDPVRASA